MNVITNILRPWLKWDKNELLNQKGRGTKYHPRNIRLHTTYQYSIHLLH